MKNLYLILLSYYTAVLFYVFSQEWQYEFSKAIGFISFLAALFFYIVFLSFLTAFDFEIRLNKMMKNIYIMAGVTSLPLIGVVFFSADLLKMGVPIIMFYIVVAVCFVMSTSIYYIIYGFMRRHNIGFAYTIKQLLNIGAEQEETAEYKAVSKLDGYMYVLALLLALIEIRWVIIFIGIMVIILAQKHLTIISAQWNKNEKALTKTVFTLAILIGVVIYYFTGHLGSIFIMFIAMLPVKIFYNRKIKIQRNK